MMRYLKSYLDTIKSRGNVSLADSIEKTANDVGSKYIAPFSYCSHDIGLLFGNVQSGKTGQMFGIMCKAADLGFSAFVLLTTDNIVLQQQTLERVQADLTGFCVCGENDSGLFIENRLMKPAVIVLKKNARILRLWANVFASTGFMKGNPLFIVDDEADAASLNDLVNRGRKWYSEKEIHIFRKDVKTVEQNLLEYLKEFDEQETAIMKGNKPVLSYFVKDEKSTLVESDYVVKSNYLIDIIKHPRFVEFPEHTHDYLEMIYMCSGSTTHVLNQTTEITLETDELLFIKQGTSHTVSAAGFHDVAVHFTILPAFLQYPLSMLREDTVLRRFIQSSADNDTTNKAFLHFHLQDMYEAKNLLENMIRSLLKRQRNSRQILQTTM